MQVIQLHEQILENTILQHGTDTILPTMEDGQEVVYTAKRGREDKELCLKLKRVEDNILATGSYFVGIDWVKEKELAVQVSPKMNDGFEIDYVKMLNEALCERENHTHLNDLVTIKFDKPSIKVTQQQDLLSIFLITEYLTLLQAIVKKGLKKSYYLVEENLGSKVKGKIMTGRNIHTNLTKGKITDNFCRFQVYDIDSPENQILKKALKFCSKQLEIYKHAFDIEPLKKKIRFINPFLQRLARM